MKKIEIVAVVKRSLIFKDIMFMWEDRNFWWASPIFLTIIGKYLKERIPDMQRFISGDKVKITIEKINGKENEK